MSVEKSRQYFERAQVVFAAIQRSPERFFSVEEIARSMSWNSTDIHSAQVQVGRLCKFFSQQLDTNSLLVSIFASKGYAYLPGYTISNDADLYDFRNDPDWLPDDEFGSAMSPVLTYMRTVTITGVDSAEPIVTNATYKDFLYFCRWQGYTVPTDRFMTDNMVAAGTAWHRVERLRNLMETIPDCSLRLITHGNSGYSMEMTLRQG